jgi:competence protein ComEC
MSGELHIVTWNVAHGSAIYVRTPNSRHILLDAGASEDFSPAEHLYHRYGLRYTDLLVLSHADCDHVRDLPNIWRLIPPIGFYRNPTSPRWLMFPTDPPEQDPLKTFDSFNQYYVQPLSPSDQIGDPNNWGGVEIRHFYNSAAAHRFDCLNDYSMVTVFNFESLCFIFPGDLEAPGWEAMMQRPDFIAATTQNRYRVLVAPHHGHTAGIYQPFLDHFEPHLSIISGAYGDPHTDRMTYANASSGLRVLHRSTNTGSTCRVLTTKRNDYVLLRQNGSGLFVSV